MRLQHGLFWEMMSVLRHWDIVAARQMINGMFWGTWLLLGRYRGWEIWYSVGMHHFHPFFRYFIIQRPLMIWFSSLIVIRSNVWLHLSVFQKNFILLSDEILLSLLLACLLIIGVNNLLCFPINGYCILSWEIWSIIPVLHCLHRLFLPMQKKRCMLQFAQEKNLSYWQQAHDCFVIGGGLLRFSSTILGMITTFVGDLLGWILLMKPWVVRHGGGMFSVLVSNEKARVILVGMDDGCAESIFFW